MPGLNKCLYDPMPEIRTVASKAIGTMVRIAGESCFREYIESLKQMLTSENSSVDRSGAAQGLSEVIAALGKSSLETTLPKVVNAVESDSSEPFVRDGYLMMFIYLPMVFGDDLIPYLSTIGLTDETEYVRDTALKAGQKIVVMYCEVAMPLLLPSLERGMFDGNWRIRFSSVQLLSELLYKITGLTGKMSTVGGEDDTFGTENCNQVILNAMGIEHRNYVLSGLYVNRSDSEYVVRQSANHIWKTVIVNTPKTLREILPVLFSLLLRCFVSSDVDRQQIAARCLGEIVSKLGDRILFDVIPALEEGITSKVAEERRGVCIALSEILRNTNKQIVMMYVEKLTQTILKAMCDSHPEVRLAGSSTLCSLYSAVGSQALEDGLEPLIGKIRDPIIGPLVTDSLEQLVSSKGRAALPFIVSKLAAFPANTTALARIAAKSGDALSKQLYKIMSVLYQRLADVIGDPDAVQQETDNCTIVLNALSSNEDAETVLKLVFDALASSKLSSVHAALIILVRLCSLPKVSVLSNANEIFSSVLGTYHFSDADVLSLAADVLNTVLKGLSLREQLDQISLLKHALNSVFSGYPPSRRLPGFQNSKTVQPILTILREGVVNGNATIRESSADLLCLVFSHCDTAALQPYVVSVTGPLIRVLGDRYAPSVRAAILKALISLLKQVDVLLKPFAPQLRSVFLKSLAEKSSSDVHLRAAEAIGCLIRIHMKPDLVIADTCRHIRSSTDPVLREMLLVALRLELHSVKGALSTENQSLIQTTVTSYLDDSNASVRIAAAAALGVFLARIVASQEGAALLTSLLTGLDTSSDWVAKHNCAVTIQVALMENAMNVTKYIEPVNCLLKFLTADRIPIVDAGLRASAYLMNYELSNETAPDPKLSNAVARSINHSSLDIKLLTTEIVSYLSPLVTADPFVLKAFVFSMLNGTKESNSSVRVSSEEALVSLLRLRDGGEHCEKILNILEPAQRGTLKELVKNRLLKVSQTTEPLIVDLDNTLRLC